MLRIGQVETTATSDNKYTDGSVAGGVAATRLRASAFNAIQEELAHIVESAGLTLDINNNEQVLIALQNLFQSRDATLTAIAALTGAANKLAYFNGVDTAALTDLTDIGRDVIGQSSVANLLSYLGLGDGSALAVGIPVPWPTSTAPTGWLKCNGATFTAAQYPKLALAYPSLVLPDLRGEFIRGWDDGRGVDSGRALLSAQGFLVESHTHDLNYRALTPEVGGATYFGGVTSATKVGLISQMSSYGGTETRPRNVAFNYIVRAA